MPRLLPNEWIRQLAIDHLLKLYEESDDTEIVEPTEIAEDLKDEGNITLTEVKGIGKGTAETLKSFGINTVEKLLSTDPEELSAKMSGASPNTVKNWQKDAKILLKT